MAKDKTVKADTTAEDIVVAAREEAAKILAAARAAADSEVTAAKEEAKFISERAVPAAGVVQDKTKRHIISVKVRAIKRGYANHRIYETGDPFTFRYWSHQLFPGGVLKAVLQEKALGGWMVTDVDPRFGKSKEELQDVRVAEADASDVTLAGNSGEDLNVL